MNEGGSSASDITIYKQAVRQLDPGLDAQIEQLLVNSCQQLNQTRKVSFSSDEMMDTSDEIEKVPDQLNTGNISVSFAEPMIAQPKAPVEPTPDEQAERLLKESEENKARMYGMTGNIIEPSPSKLSVAEINQDYQMIDAHVDQSIKKKIIDFEYIDLCKLLIRHKPIKEEDNQRLEIINRNGMSYLSPVSEREALQVTNYNLWEQAFRIYSNVLTSNFPGKASELLQYNHTIHTASMSYVWDNVYAYNREFRQYISHHPQRPWNVILQQAWTMLLKDRVKNDNHSFFQRGNGSRQGKKNGEPCCRFNKGCCSFGLSCKYDHRCSVPKCGKFGHGAHICRLQS